MKCSDNQELRSYNNPLHLLQQTKWKVNLPQRILFQVTLVMDTIMQKSNKQDFSMEYFNYQTAIVGTNIKSDILEELNTKKCVRSLTLL